MQSQGKGETFGTGVSLDGYEEDGNPPALGAGNTAFDSPVPDVLDGNWKKSTRSQNTNCVEARWTKSTQSGGGNCVETRIVEDRVEVRDSKDFEGPILSFTTSQWKKFLTLLGGDTCEAHLS